MSSSVDMVGAVKATWIWSETLSFAELAAPATLALLRRFGVQPLVAVQPPQLADLPRLTAALTDAAVTFGLWPMLDDAAGRWANAANLPAFLAYCDRALEAASKAPPSTLAIDLEPNIERTRPLILGHLPRRGTPAGTPYEAAHALLASYVARLHGRGMRTLAAALPLVLHQLDDQPVWERRLGTPLSGIGFQHISVMTYPSLVEGWSRGVLERRHAQEALSIWAQRAAKAGLGISLGAVGLGAFGNERRYRSPAELAEDVALVSGLGVESIALLDLGGVLRRPPAEAWLEALVDPPPFSVVIGPSRRVRALVATLDGAARLLG